MKKYIIFLVFLLIGILLVMYIGSTKDDPFVQNPFSQLFDFFFNEEFICNKIIHNIDIPSFTAEQEQIINKYRNIIHSKLLHPDMYFILSIKENSNKTYLFILFPLKTLQEYKSDYDHCASGMTLDSDVWFVVNESGEIIESNELGHPFKDEIFR